jgi:alcohol dehydrogenase, propanol-preferring
LKAAIFEKFGAPLIVGEVPLPVLGNDQVLLKVGACGVCYTDIKIWKGIPGYSTTLPHVLGHEIAGTVMERGAEVKSIKEGERFVVYLYDTCNNKCFYCQNGRENECINRVGFIGSDRWGGYAEYVGVRSDNLLRIPENLSFEEAAPLADAGLTPYHAIVDIARVNRNETALLVGMGGLALMGLQILKLLGARVIAVSRTESKLEMAKRFGADLTIEVRNGNDGVEEVKRFTDGYGVDHVFDFVGSAETVTRDTKYVRRGGDVLLLGYQPGEQMIPVLTLRGFLSIGGSNSGTRKDLRELVRLASEGKLKSIVTKSFPLEEANTALTLLERGQVAGRLIIRMG